jgi:hypothetical protein
MNQAAVNNTETSNNQAQGFIADAKAYVNEERGTLTHVITDDIRIVMPINLYKKILGLSFTPKEKEESAARASNSFGLQARPAIYLSKDGRYLVHRVLGVRVSKHVNFYKKILGAEYTSDVRVAQSA